MQPIGCLDDMGHGVAVVRAYMGTWLQFVLLAQAMSFKVIQFMCRFCHAINHDGYFLILAALNFSTLYDGIVLFQVV